MPIGVRRWLRAYAPTTGLALHEVVLEAVDRHAETLRSAPPRAGRPIVDGVRVDLYLEGDGRSRVEGLAMKLGWSVSETVSELLGLERASAAADPDAVARRVADRLRGDIGG